jgi:hypothetical protein
MLPYSDDQRFNLSRTSWRCFSNMRRVLPKGTPAWIVQKLGVPLIAALTAQKIGGLQAGEPKPTQAASPRR